MDKTIKEILDATKGINDDGSSKVGVSVSLEMLNALTRQIEHIDDAIFLESNVDIKRHDAFLQIDLMYKTSTSEDLLKMWEFIDTFYSNALDTTADDVNRTPMCLVSILPYALNGEYYIQAINPIFWSLQPKAPGSSYTIVRLKFEETDVQFLRGEISEEFFNKVTERTPQNQYEKYSYEENEEDDDFEDFDF